MKKFGFKLLIFSLPALLFFVLTTMFYFFSKSKVNSKLKEISKYKCLLMGDSQIQCLNEALIGENSKNIASFGEHYYFTYNKLQKITKNKNHKIDKVILGVSIHNFSPVYNRLFNLDFPEGKKSLRRYLYFIQISNNSNFIKKLLVKQLILSVYSAPDWGGFYVSNNSNPSIEIINKTFNMHYSRKQNEEKFSNSQKTYLYKIDSICTSNNIELKLISAPYHIKYKEKIDVEYYAFFSKTLEKLNQRHHLNFITDKVDSSFMSDANHLNKFGGKYYSEMIRKEIDARTHNKLNKK